MALRVKLLGKPGKIDQQGFLERNIVLTDSFQHAQAVILPRLRLNVQVVTAAAFNLPLLDLDLLSSHDQHFEDIDALVAHASIITSPKLEHTNPTVQKALSTCAIGNETNTSATWLKSQTIAIDPTVNATAKTQLLYIFNQLQCNSIATTRLSEATLIVMAPDERPRYMHISKNVNSTCDFVTPDFVLGLLARIYTEHDAFQPGMHPAVPTQARSRTRRAKTETEYQAIIVLDEEDDDDTATSLASTTLPAPPTLSNGNHQSASSPRNDTKLKASAQPTAKRSKGSQPRQVSIALTSSRASSTSTTSPQISQEPSTTASPQAKKKKKKTHRPKKSAQPASTSSLSAVPELQRPAKRSVSPKRHSWAVPSFKRTASAQGQLLPLPPSTSIPGFLPVTLAQRAPVSSKDQLGDDKLLAFASRTRKATSMSKAYFQNVLDSKNPDRLGSMLLGHLSSEHEPLPEFLGFLLLHFNRSKAFVSLLSLQALCNSHMLFPELGKQGRFEWCYIDCHKRTSKQASQPNYPLDDCGRFGLAAIIEAIESRRRYIELPELVTMEQHSQASQASQSLDSQLDGPVSPSKHLGRLAVKYWRRVNSEKMLRFYRWRYQSDPLASQALSAWSSAAKDLVRQLCRCCEEEDSVAVDAVAGILNSLLPKLDKSALDTASRWCHQHLQRDDQEAAFRYFIRSAASDELKFATLVHRLTSMYSRLCCRHAPAADAKPTTNDWQLFYARLLPVCDVVDEDLRGATYDQMAARGRAMIADVQAPSRRCLVADVQQLVLISRRQRWMTKEQVGSFVDGFAEHCATFGMKIEAQVQRRLKLLKYLN